MSIEINRVTLKLEIKGATKQIVQDAKDTITKRIEKLRSEHWEVPVSGDMIGLIIGKQGATINKIRAESGANVDFDAKLYVLRVSGGEDKVADARAMIEEIIAAEEKNKASTRYVSIPAAAIPCVIGTKGNTSREIQNVSGARLDVDRVNLRCVLKGSEEACAKAIEMIEELLDKEGYSKPPVVTVVTPVAPPVVVEEQRSEPVVVAGGKKGLPGANPDQLTRQQLAGMSKSALKRYRKKMAGGESNAAEEEDEEVVQVVTRVNTSVPPPLEVVEEEEPEVEEVKVTAPSPVVPPVFISAIPTPAPVVHVPVPVPAVSLVIPSAASLPAKQAGVPTSPVRLGAPAPISVGFNFNNLMGNNKQSAVGVIGRSSGHAASPPAVAVYSSFDKQISSFETHLQIGSNSNAVEPPIFVAAASPAAPVAVNNNLFLQPPAPVYAANGTAVNAPTPVSSNLFSRLLGPTTPQASVLPVYKAPQAQQQQQQLGNGFAQQPPQAPAWGSNSSFAGPSFIQQQQQLHQQQMQLQQQQQQLYMQQQQFAQAQQQFAQQQQMPQPPQQNYNGMMTLNNQQQQQQFPPLSMRQNYAQQAPPGIGLAPPGLMYGQAQQQGQQQQATNVGSAIGNGVGQYSPEFVSSLCQPSTGPSPSGQGDNYFQQQSNTSGYNGRL